LFALPKELPAKRVNGYCHLSDKLPAFYRWVDTQFPAGNIKLSLAADARYNQVYESIGLQATAASTPAVRAWMRKLPGQLLRIALALHVIECYHEPGRPRHELQVDTLNRAVDVCRYYRSAFEVVQESASDSDRVSSILLKIWDMAATSPTGLVVRDAYRSIKALSRRAKELGRNVAAYTIDLYYKLEKLGRGSIQKDGRIVRFVAGGTNPPESSPTSECTPNPPDSPDDTDGVTNLATKNQGVGADAKKQGRLYTTQTTHDTPQTTQEACPVFPGNLPYLETKQTRFDTNATLPEGCPDFSIPGSVTAVTVDETAVTQGLDVSPQELVSLVTKQDLDQVDMHGSEIDVQNFPVELDTLVSMENISGSNCISDESEASPGEEILKEVEPVSSDSITHRVAATTKPSGDDETQLLSQFDIQSWLDRIATVQNADECMDCLDALHQLPQPATEYIWSSAETLLPRFWSVAEIEVTEEPHQNPGVGFGTVVSPQQQPSESDERIIITPGADSLQLPGVGFGSQASPIQPSELDERITITPGAEQPDHKATTNVRELITGLWVRCRDGFYGHLGALTGDGRWWVSSPKSRTSDAESRLYAAADIIPMPAS
jgi:hypothetical protein